MSDGHAHHPIIWEVLGEGGKRLTTLVAHDLDEATEVARKLYGVDAWEVRDTGKRKPPGKCCDKCGNKPCGS